MPGPVVVGTRRELDGLLAERRHAGKRIALVPTMGALHAGHASLLRSARDSAGVVVVSVFVNPLQFAPGEDLGRYPRTLAADLETCAREGTDIVFLPAVDEMYLEGLGAGVGIDPGPLGSVLEGVPRPTHFRGVLTVVTKLFGLVRPDEAWFGEKDYQQLVLIRRMVLDLCMAVAVRGAPIVRDSDGLALSSRNSYLDASARAAGLALSRGLAAGVAAASAGAGPAAVEAAMVRVLADEPRVDPDYAVLTGPDLGPPPAVGPARLLVAGQVGGTRLLDNVAVELMDRPA